MTIRENVDLAPMTTLKVGGPAKYYANVSTLKELESAINFGKEKSLPVFVLGGGSNVLISDKGFDGLVVHLSLMGLEFSPSSGDSVRATVCSGEDWDAFVGETVERGLYGVENMSYVPGSVGAAPIQNIGCYGAEVSEVIDWVEVFDPDDLRVTKMRNDDCRFGYRTSIFKKEMSDKVVTRVSFLLSRTGKVNVEYHDFKTYIEDTGSEINSPKDVRRALFAIRTRKGMTILAGAASLRSAGSFFKAPEPVSIDTLERIRRVVMEEDAGKAKDLEPWYWEQKDRMYKVAPAFLMEFTEYNKTDFSGKAFNGTVGISPKHSLSLINLGDARAQDIYDFAQTIQKEINNKFGIKLENEVRFVGF